MSEFKIEATPMGFAGEKKQSPITVVRAVAQGPAAEAAQKVPEGGSTAPELVDFPLTEEAFKRFQQAAELPSEDWLEDNMDLHIREAEYEAERAKLAREKLPKLRRKARHYRNAVLSYFIGWGVVGFVLGVVLAVSQLLERHGPTVTIHGTIGAMVIYVVAGLVLGAIFAMLGREHATSMANDYAARAKEMRETADAAEQNRVYHIEQAEAYDRELRQRRFAWYFDDFQLH